MLVIITKPNPSFDYYLAPRLFRVGMPPVQVFSTADSPSDVTADLLDGALVLFCRYMSGAWLTLVERNADRIAGVGYFVDDDLDALFNDPAVPITYRAGIFHHALRHRRRLSQLLDVMFVSNERVGRRHDLTDARVLTPISGRMDDPVRKAPTGQPIRLAFHSTRVHAREHRWLSAVMTEFMSSGPNVQFEVVAANRLASVWQSLSRTTIRKPLSWPDYRAWTRHHGVDLLLAPLLPNPGNVARSPTKRIEATRLGAALIVTDPIIYEPSAEERALGMCVPPDPDAWVRALRELVLDRSRVSKLRSLNRQFVMAERANVSALLRADEVAL